MVDNLDEFPPLKYVSDISTTRQIDDQLSDNQVDSNKGACTSDSFIEQNDVLSREDVKLIEEHIKKMFGKIRKRLDEW